MDTSGFFQYPGEPAPARAVELLGDWSDAEWAALLAATETRRFAPGEVVLAEGEHDPALYLLTDGRLEGPNGVVEPIATVGEGAFFDRRPRAASVRALTHGEVLRLSRDAFEALAAREPRLARALLLELGRVLAERARIAGGPGAEWTG